MFRVAILAAGLLAGALAFSATPSDYSPPTEEEFRANTSFPYKAAVDRLERVRAAAPRLRRCMPEAEILGLLGAPDYGYTRYREGSNGTVPEVIVWHYVLAQRTTEQRKQDAHVVVWMNLDGQLRAMSVNNLPGVLSIDALKGECS